MKELFWCVVTLAFIAIAALVASAVWSGSEANSNKYQIVEEYSQKYENSAGVQQEIKTALEDGVMTNYEFELIVSAVDAERVARIKKQLNEPKRDLKLNLSEYDTP